MALHTWDFREQMPGAGGTNKYSFWLVSRSGAQRVELTRGGLAFIRTYPHRVENEQLVRDGTGKCSVAVNLFAFEMSNVKRRGIEGRRRLEG